MFNVAVWIVIFCIVFKVVIEYRAWLDLDRDVILSVTPGICQNVIEDGGSEDLTHVGNGLVLMSTGLSMTPGHIRALQLNKYLKLTTMNIINPPERSDFMYKPHGLSAWRDPQTGKLYLHVISHASVESVEVFEVDEDKLVLKHLKTITDSSFTLQVYVAEWGSKVLRAYRREPDNSLVEIWNKYVATGIDNIEVNPDNGDLWIGAVQSRWKVIDILNRNGAKHPAQVLRIKLSDNFIADIEEIFSDDGNIMSGTSVATYVDGKAVIGTVSNTAAVCDVNYLSKNEDVKK